MDHAPGFLKLVNEAKPYVKEITIDQARERLKENPQAILMDVRAGFNVGPLSIGAMGMFTSGQDAKSNPFRTVDYYQPLDTDTSYAADWGTQIFSLGIDYFNILHANVGGLNPGVAIGYDRYGRIQLCAKAAYAITPALTFGFDGGMFQTTQCVKRPPGASGSVTMSASVFAFDGTSLMLSGGGTDSPPQPYRFWIG